MCSTVVAPVTAPRSIAVPSPKSTRTFEVAAAPVVVVGVVVNEVGVPSAGVVPDVTVMAIVFTGRAPTAIGTVFVEVSPELCSVAVAVAV